MTMPESMLSADAISPKLAQLAGLAAHYADPEFSVAHGGHVRTIAAGHYTVSGLSRHVRLGEFVAHRSATGLHPVSFTHFPAHQTP